jgi:hypothetical protein
MRLQMPFVDGNSRTEKCTWPPGFSKISVFRLYPYEHQERKCDFPYFIIGFDIEATTHLCIRKDIPWIDQAKLAVKYLVEIFASRDSNLQLTNRRIYK